MSSSEAKNLRFQGSLLGAAVGDALGWPQEVKGQIIGGQTARDARQPVAEFSPWSRNAGSRFAGTYIDPVHAGQYSDDTQLICAVARACLTGPNWLVRLRDVELPSWKFYQRGGGRAVLSSASSWSRGVAPWERQPGDRNIQKERHYRQAGGNGVAMRIAPHVLAGVAGFYEFSSGELAKRIISDGVLTHGHPRALIGAIAYGGVLHAALTTQETVGYGALVGAAGSGLIPAVEASAILPRGWGNASDIEEFELAWQSGITEMRHLLDVVNVSLEKGGLSNVEETLREIGSFNPEIHGSGTVTAAGAIYLASRSAARPLSGLLDAAFARKADTDTLASMTGAVLGAIHGVDWLEPFLGVQDAGYVRDLGTSLWAGTTRTYPKPTRDPERLGRLMRLALRKGGLPEQQTEFPDGRKYSILNQAVLQEDPHFGRSLLELDDGQTVVVDQRINAEDLAAVTQGPPAERGQGSLIPDIAAGSTNTGTTPTGTSERFVTPAGMRDRETVPETTIAQMLTHELSAFDKQRHRTWISQLAMDLERNAPSLGKPPKELLVDSRLRAAALKALAIVRESISEDKESLLRVAVGNSFTGSRFSTVQINHFMNLLRQYEFLHIDVLLTCRDASSPKAEFNENALISKLSAEVVALMPLDLLDASFILKELQRDGLLAQHSGATKYQSIVTELGVNFLSFCGIGDTESPEFINGA